MSLIINPAGWHVMLGQQVASKTDDPGQAAHGALEPSVGQGMSCNKETEYIVLMYGPWGFQKCIWDP